MSANRENAARILARILEDGDANDRAAALHSRSPQEHPLPPRVPGGTGDTPESLERRRQHLRDQGIDLTELTHSGPPLDPASLQGNIENLVGEARIPVGVIGPLRVNGTYAAGDYYVPLATSEGALVASFARGASAISLAGGASVACLTECVSRAPNFIFDRLADSALFLSHVLPRFDELQEVVSRTSRYCRLIDLRVSLSGRDVFLIFDFSTGDASGQNMVTFATDAICRHLLEASPIQPRHWYVEGNMSGDKKATIQSFATARGKKVVAEAILPEPLVRRVLRSTPDDMERYCKRSTLGGLQSGSIGVQGHFANALAALFIACGQDAACVSEASIGLTIMDVTDDGSLYVSVTLPNLIVGTVGGGTGLPTARECLAMLGCHGSGQAKTFAEICGATVLAGEISIIAALAAGDFTSAHQRYGRKAPR